MNVTDAKGLTFECKPGCGFCCTSSPLVAPHEAGPLGPLVIRDADGTLRIPYAGHACSSLQADRRCGVYDVRPSVCHLYPYAVHAGRRIQVTVSLACPGIERWHAAHAPDTDGDPIAHPFGVANHAEEGARRAGELALAQPGAKENAAQAKSTFAEFDRRMKEWGVAAPVDKLRAGLMPHLDALAQPALLPSFFAGLESGELVLGSDPARDIGALFTDETDVDLHDLFRQAAQDAFDEPETVIWVEPDFTWVRAEASESEVKLMRQTTQRIATDDVPAEWDAEASAVLAAYLARLLQRDHTEGAAFWLVDASQYQVTPAAAYARRGVTAYETAFHSLPTLGSIL